MSETESTTRSTKSRKIGTLTFFRNYNHGAVLQAYALQKYLESIGVEATLLDYDRHKRRRPRLGYGVRSGRILANFKRRATFDKFIQAHLKVTEPFIGSEEFQRFTRGYDALIVGSDQVWKAADHRALDPSFFLKTAPEFQGIKVSYAPSASGIPNFGRHAESIKALLPDFAGLSVRDDHTAQLIRNLGFENIQVVVDPTVLWDFEEMKGAESSNEPYLFSYFLSSEPWFPEACSAYEKESGLKFRHFDQSFGQGNREYVKGPREWVQGIYGAKAVFTNSFHGLQFAVKFGKPVFVFPRAGAEDKKLSTFLARFAPELPRVQVDTRPEWSLNAELKDRCLAARELVFEDREKSMSFLKGVLNT